MKFDFSKSTQVDLQNKFQYLFQRLDSMAVILRYNNQLLLELKRHIKVDFDLQKTVDQFYNTSPVGSPIADEEPDS